MKIKMKKTSPAPNVPDIPREVRSLSMDSIYNNGFDAVFLPRDTYQQLMDILDTVEWLPDEDGEYNAIPKWLWNNFATETENQVKRESQFNQINLACKPLVDACHAIIKNGGVMGEWLEAFTPELTLITLWDGAEDLDWHWDGPCQTDFFFLIYLNKKRGWPENGGGELFTGKRSLKSGYMHTDPDDVIPLNGIRPSSRTLVCCNNENPSFVHKVVPLREADERIVLMVGFNLLPTMQGRFKQGY